MQNRIVSAVSACMFIIALHLFGAVYAFIHGSTEMHPTPEQHEKVRIVAGIFIIIFSAAEIALYFVRRSIKKRYSS